MHRQAFLQIPASKSIIALTVTVHQSKLISSRSNVIIKSSKEQNFIGVSTFLLLYCHFHRHHSPSLLPKQQLQLTYSEEAHEERLLFILNSSSHRGTPSEVSHFFVHVYAFVIICLHASNHRFIRQNKIREHN